MTASQPAKTDPLDQLMSRLQADCTAAETAERTVRASVDAQIKAAERARAFAWRRLNALTDMAREARRESDREAAVERQLEALFREIGWIEQGLSELGEGAQPLIDRLRPVAEALHAQAHPPPPSDDAADDDAKAVEPEPVVDPLSAFREFENWYEAERGQPFLQVFERYVPPTPVVEF
jgi:hypothetical protein